MTVLPGRVLLEVVEDAPRDDGLILPEASKPFVVGRVVQSGVSWLHEGMAVLASATGCMTLDHRKLSCVPEGSEWKLYGVLGSCDETIWAVVE